MQWAKQNVFREFMIRQPLVVALLLSLLIHTGAYGFWKLGKQLHWWDHQATWLLKILEKKPKPLDLQKLIQKQLQEMAAAQQKKEIPLTFVEVDPTTLALEPPKEAKYYGALNAKAANPDSIIDSLKPKVDGKQEQVVRTETVSKPQPLQPAPPPEKTEPKKAEKTEQVSDKPKPTETPGDLALAKPEEKPKEKPRTLAAARAQKNLVGEPMKQSGGAKQRGKIAFDVKQTPFGSYDAAFIAAVQQRWFDLLDSTQFAQRSGKVVLEFKLMYDGRILDMKVNGNEVGELLGLLCQRAISDPAPFPQWPSDMRRMVGGNYREVTFTFYYN
jgi:outer membrane biosynthesis protein TonB